MQHEQTAKQIESQAGGIQQKMEQLPSNFYYWAVIGSIGISAVLMLMRRWRLAVFVGLWPPTLLNLGLFNKILRPSKEMGQENFMGSKS